MAHVLHTGMLSLASTYWGPTRVYRIERKVGTLLQVVRFGGRTERGEYGTVGCRPCETTTVPAALKTYPVGDGRCLYVPKYMQGVSDTLSMIGEKGNEK